jgi:EpsI family protein
LLLAPVCNWVRVYVIVVAGHLTDMKSFLVTVDHYWFGWVLFSVFMWLFLMLAGRIERRGSVKAAAANPTVAPISGGPRLSGYLAILVGVACVPVAAYAIHSSVPTAGPSRVDLPKSEAPWSGPLLGFESQWAPVYPGAHHTARATYVNPRGTSVTVFVAVYLSQSQGAELVGYDNSLSGADGEMSDETEVTAAGLKLREGILTQSSHPAAVIWWVYDVGGRDTSEPLAAQLLYGVHSLHSSPVSTLSAFSAPCMPDCAAARAILESFVPTMAPRIKASLKEIGQ